MLILNFSCKYLALYQSSEGDRTMLILNVQPFYTLHCNIVEGDRTMLILNRGKWYRIAEYYQKETVQC